jgi:ABC-type oligopeptide transport system substrate-binding subunit
VPAPAPVVDPLRLTGSRAGVALRLISALLGLVLAVTSLPQPGRVAAQDEVRARIAGGAPLTWDPAQAGETDSANMLAQVFETLTAFDWHNQIQPALAESWTVAQDGQRIEFQLRPNLRYSDGSPIRGQDVVDSWLRLLDPADPSPLASLLADVRGANDYLAGRVARDGVGLSADEDTVVVELRRPATYFLAVTGSPSLAVVPPSMWEMLDTPVLPDEMVVSGAYVPTDQTDTTIRLEASVSYWAGTPPLGVLEVVTDLGGTDPVTAFLDESVDYVGIGSWDASWIKYDRALGPQLRLVDAFVVHYYGFDTTRPPFDDARVRLAFAKAVDWDRLTRLADEQPATSLVPFGIPGVGDEDYRPAYEPEEARRLLDEWRAEVEPEPTPQGATSWLDDLALVSNGYGYEVAVAQQLEESLGIAVRVELMDFGAYLALRGTDFAPRFWTISWSADYPHAHDFLGLLLESGSSSNEGRWSNADYDAAIEAAAATADPDEQAALYAAAQQILRDEAPVVPVSYGESWALSRDGLLGALPSGVGYLRFAGLDWAAGSDR